MYNAAELETMNSLFSDPAAGADFSSPSRSPITISFRSSRWAWRGSSSTGSGAPCGPVTRQYNQAARFWAKIFGLNFAVGVVTGIPMEFQFGTNWAGFSKYAGGVIGQTLAMEGMFAFFLESAFYRPLIWGEKRLGPRYHFLAALAVALGSWLSGYFILVTNAFMQHPVGYRVEADGSLGFVSLSDYLLNPWAWVQFAHNQMAALVTGSFVVAAVGAFYALRGLHPRQARLYLGGGTFAGLIASLFVAFPTGDQQAKMVGNHQPATLAAMEGRFSGGSNAGVAVIGQPNVRARRLDNPIEIPGALSFLAYGHFGSYVHGLDDYPQDRWPDNIELLYYSFHLMITLGTLFILLMAFANSCTLRGRLESGRWLLWVLMLAFPFPYIANTLGWMTAELGRQPWLIYGLFRTSDGYSKVVSSGDTVFTLIGFVGLYSVLGLLFLFLVGREISHGPEEDDRPAWRGAISMIAMWYAIVSFMLIVYLVLDGRNFGAGMLHWLVAQDAAERRQVVAAIGPLWTWHEVWLVGFGGTLLAVFPKLLASAFAGYYLALFLILWCLILRGISLEVGGHIDDRMWQGFWDFVFVVANTLLAILFGAAAGNMVRGVPLASDGTFSMAFFTDFTARGYVGLLDWYTLSVALFAIVVLAAHGATYLTLKTQGPVHDRSASYARVLWAAAVPLLLVISIESAAVRPICSSTRCRIPFGGSACCWSVPRRARWFQG